MKFLAFNQILVNGPSPESYDPPPAINLWIEKDHKYSDDVHASKDPNTGLDPAPLLPPERSINDETSEVITFEDDEEETVTQLDHITFPDVSTLADDAEDIDFIYPPFGV
uniref:Uncharacterized protein n=1 Tax=Panagrolaimus davidi TaxID=227884 RepID=A0A914Q7P7_9BILA